jgi:ABC-2 type transport system ATP-binding protein/lipopolysaccharide transport system ATP-binding protein
VSARPAIRLDGVSLCYRLAKQRIATFKDYAIHLMKGALAYEKLWALQEVSLTVGRGESVGVVGRNGAGKSTLLKVVSGVLKATRGRVEIDGRVAPVLALGTGFDFELTGLENVHLNALLLGRTRKEVGERLEEIVAFSGLGDFIRSPIRNYSSGMLARLGFAIATAWPPDILILDEVLGVGDARFLRRCDERLRSFHRAGTTLLLVSHDVDSVRDACERTVWIEGGRVRADGPTAEVVEAYEKFSLGDGAGI